VLSGDAPQTPYVPHAASFIEPAADNEATPASAWDA